MKKLLLFLGVITFSSITTNVAISCSKPVNPDPPTPEVNKEMKDIKEISDELQKMLDAYEWISDESNLQNELDNKFGFGAITVIKQNTKSFENTNQDWLFIGNEDNKDDNNKIYYFGEIILTQVGKIENTKNIFEVQENIKLILNKRTDKSWLENGGKVTELQDDIDNSGIDTKGGIKVVWSPKNNKIIKDETTSYKFIGNGDKYNSFKYEGEIELVHNWTSIQDTAKNISDIKEELYKNVLTARMFDKWTTDELENLIVSNEYDKKNGISVKLKDEAKQEIGNGKTFLHTDKYEIIGNGNPYNEYKYKDSFLINHNWVEGLEEKELSEKITIYEEKNEIKTTENFDFSKIEDDIIFKFGTKESSNKQYIDTIKNSSAFRVTTVLPSNLNSIESVFSLNKNGLIYGIENWNTENILNISKAFYDAQNFNTDISKWDTSKVINMSELFAGANYFAKDISIWNTSAVTDMSGMFKKNIKFNFDLSTKKVINNGLTYEAWNVENVQNMSQMFMDSDFNNGGGWAESNNPLKWNTKRLYSMYQMFSGTTSFNQPLDYFDTLNVSQMSGLFKEAWSFNQDLSKWNTSNVTDMSQMFYSINKNFNSDISKWNTSKVINMSEMFYNAFGFNQDINTKDVEIENSISYTAWNTSNVTNMRKMFSKTRNFDKNINNWNIENVKDFDFFMQESWFDQDISTWIIKKTTSTILMFEGAKISENHKPKILQ
ncbi:BspA family leucine-rich repeat surface protein [Mesoplasma florum]|uniref:BspA family leucine-rich repeat surface protein n=1 Tax=Mesoplasma florum TaxID=2151 RepID=UPI000BE46982|nr:BspA family leucine-rich repeat surface protein [Mesoplasma florum]ATI73996.1 hypothetical protein CQZ70_01875 [Mesoplasma florum]